MSSIETWPVPAELLALIDTAAIEQADAELAAAEEVCRRAADSHDRARAAAIAAGTEWDELRRRSNAGAVVSSEEISRVHRAQSDGGIVAAFRSDAVLAAKAALDRAKIGHGVRVAEAHAKLAEEGIRLRILAGRACDLATAVSSAFAADPAETERRRPRFEMELAEARRLFVNGSACLWRAVRAGFRGNFPENFGISWPTSERHERAIFNMMPREAFPREMRLLPRIEALNRLLNRMNAACSEAIRAPGVQADALTARALQIRRKADRLISDARNGNLNAENQVGGPLFVEVACAVAMYEEVAEAELAAA